MTSFREVVCVQKSPKIKKEAVFYAWVSIHTKRPRCLSFLFLGGISGAVGEKFSSHCIPPEIKNKLTIIPTSFSEKPCFCNKNGIYVPKEILTADFIIEINAKNMQVLFFKISFMIKKKIVIIAYDIIISVNNLINETECREKNDFVKFLK